MRITSIKLSKVDEKENTAEGVAISYSVFNDATQKHDKLTLKADELPLPEFVAAVVAGAELICEINEFPKTWTKDVICSGIGLSFDGHDNSKVVIKGHRTLKNGGPLIVNTPNTPVTCEKDDAYTVSAKCAVWIDEVCGHAEDYINGKRSQQSLELKAVNSTAEKVDERQQELATADA